MNSAIHIKDIGVDRGSRTDGPEIVWVPSEHIICRYLKVPPVSKKKWQAMVPWMLEDMLLEKADSLNIVCGDREKDGGVPVVAVSAACLEAWRQQLKEAQISHGCLIPDFFALPCSSGQVVAAVDSGRCILRWGQWQGAAGKVEVIAPLLKNLLAKNDHSLLVYVDGQTELPSVLSAGHIEPIPEDLFREPSQPWLEIDTLHDFERRAAWPLPGKIAAGLAGLAAVLLVAGSVIETRQIEAEASHLDEQLRRGYQTYFGERYDFPMEDFQRVVSARIERQDSSGIKDALEKFAVAVNSCGDCRVDSLVVKEGQLSALVSSADKNVPPRHISQYAGRASGGRLVAYHGDSAMNLSVWRKLSDRDQRILRWALPIVVLLALALLLRWGAAEQTRAREHMSRALEDISWLQNQGRDISSRGNACPASPALSESVIVGLAKQHGVELGDVRQSDASAWHLSVVSGNGNGVLSLVEALTCIGGELAGLQLKTLDDQGSVSGSLTVEML